MSLLIQTENITKRSVIMPAVIYARVSSVKQLTRGDGLNSQITRCSEYAKYKNYEIVEIFKDDSSGSLTKRPGMLSMLSYLKKHRNEPHVVIIDDISRLARGVEAHLELRSAISEAGGKLESPSIEFGEDSDSQLVENLLAAVSQHQRQKNGEQTKNRMRSRALNGYWVFHAPLGYRFEKVAGHNKLLIRHEPMASIIKEMLEGYASGRFETQAECVRFLETFPNFPRDGKGYIRNQRVKDILNNPIYAGMVYVPNWDVSMRKGHHEGIISFEMHRAIQDKLHGKPKVPVRKDINADFPLRGFIVCGDCNNPVTACWAQGRTKKYAYYHCPTKGCASYGKSVRREKIESEFEEILLDLEPSRGLFDVACNIFKSLWRDEQARHEQNKKALKKEIAALDEQVAGLMDRIVSADNPSLIKAYEKRVQALENDKLVLKEKIIGSAKPRMPLEETLRTALDYLSNPVKLWRSESLKDKKMVLKLTFAKRLAYTKKDGFRTALTKPAFSINSKT